MASRQIRQGRQGATAGGAKMKYLVLVDNRPMGLYENQDEGWGMYFAQPYYPAMLFGSYNAELTAIAKY